MKKTVKTSPETVKISYSLKTTAMLANENKRRYTAKLYRIFAAWHLIKCLDLVALTTFRKSHG